MSSSDCSSGSGVYGNRYEQIYSYFTSRYNNKKGIDKLTNAWWGQLARVTQLQMLIKGQYGRALIYSEGFQLLHYVSHIHHVYILLEQTSQLANEIVNNPKLSDLAPISLVPQVTVNFDEIKKKLDDVEIKVSTGDDHVIHE